MTHINKYQSQEVWNNAYSRLIALIAPIKVLPISTPFKLPLHSPSHQEAESVSPLLELGWPCDLVWSTESNGSGVPVLRLGFRRSCTLLLLSFFQTPVLTMRTTLK